MKAIGTHSVQPKSSKARVPFFANSQKQGFFNRKEKNGFFSEVQTKLQVGKPGDKYEVEADAMADKVVQTLQQKEVASPPFFNPGKPAVALQPQTAEEEIQQKEEKNEEKEAQEKIALKPEVSVEEGGQVISGKSELEVRPKADKHPENQQGNSNGFNSLVQPQAKPKPILQQKSGIDILQSKEEDPEEELQLKCSNCEKDFQGKIAVQAKGNNSRSSSSLERQLNTTKGGGTPLEKNTRQKMESAFNADFSSVKVHTDSQSTGMSKSINAQAFTHGNDIYFNEGRYNPASISGQHLLAHELTHTVQQGAAVMRSPETFSLAPPMVQGLGVIDLIPDWIINNARQIPGYTLFTVIIEYDPLLEQEVERTPIRLIEGLMGLVPFGTAIFDKLQEYGIIDRVFEWVSGQLNSLNLTTQGMLDLLEEAWEEMEFPYTDAIEIITSKFQRLLNRIRSFAVSLVDQLITWIKEALIGVAEPILEENRAWSLIKKIIHYDPLRDEPVEASTVEILEDFLLLIDKETELEQMRERGTLQETADWLDTQIGTFTSLIAELRQLIVSAWDAIQPQNLPEIVDNLQALAGQVSGFLQRVWNFATTVASRVLELIKDALLGWLNSFAADISGFTLITVVLGRNPLTDEEVPRSVENIIRGFMGLVPGGEAKFQELKESGVIPRAAGQIEAIVAELGFTWPAIKQLFTDIWNSFSIEDLVDPLAAFERIAAQFGEPISRLFTFVVKVVKVLVELVLEIMGIPPDMIANIIANAMQAFEDIKQDPIGFLLNLMNAVKEGFLSFLNDIGTHLMSGFQNWLFGTLADAGVQIPADLSLRSILGMAMELLGITVDNILERLALKIGEERMAQIRSVIDTLTGIWAFVKDVIERGPIAIWEYIQDQISNLWNVIKEGIMGFIQEKVIQQAIGWLMSFLDVTGIMPVIRGVQTVFNAITSFIEKLREILGIVNSFVAGVADIAKGSIQTAAAFLETALADGIPVAISFLAKQLGLGDISEKIQEMIENARGMINEGIDWLIDKAMAAGTAFLGMLGLGGGQESEEEGNDNPEIVAEVAEALGTIGSKESRKLDGGNLSYGAASEVAAEIKREYSIFSIFEVVDGGDSWNYHYVANPNDIYGDNEERPGKTDIDLDMLVNDLLMDKINDNYFKVTNINPESGQISLSPLNSDAFAVTLNIETLQQDIQNGNWTKLEVGGSVPVRKGDLIKAPYRTGTYLAYIVDPLHPGLVSYSFRGQNGTFGKSFNEFTEMLSRQEIIIIRVDRDFLRSQTPSRELQAKAQTALSISEPDPAFPSLTVDETPQAEHIIPFNDIINIPGFHLLTIEQQIAVLNLEDNIVVLSRRANASKGTKSYREWTRHESLGIEVDPGFRRRMIARENQARQAIIAKTDAFVEENSV